MSLMTRKWENSLDRSELQDRVHPRRLTVSARADPHRRRGWRCCGRQRGWCCRCGGEVAEEVACEAGDGGDLGTGRFEAAESGVFTARGDAATSVDRYVHLVAIGEGVQGGVQDHDFGDDSAEDDHTAPVTDNGIVGAGVIPAARAGRTDV
jgi:hypothetical protein